LIAALCLSFFVIVSLLFERILHAMHRALTKMHRAGILMALHKMQQELMLAGFVTLMLMAFQGPIISWCGECSRRHVRMPAVVPASHLISALSWSAAGCSRV
jgi:hypothetical protein